MLLQCISACALDLQNNVCFICASQHLYSVSMYSRTVYGCILYLTCDQQLSTLTLLIAFTDSPHMWGELIKVVKGGLTLCQHLCAGTYITLCLLVRRDGALFSSDVFSVCTERGCAHAVSSSHNYMMYSTGLMQRNARACSHSRV